MNDIFLIGIRVAAGVGILILADHPFFSWRNGLVMLCIVVVSEASEHMGAAA